MSEINKSKGYPNFALAIAEGRTVHDAANAAGFSERTGYRRLEKKEWQDAIQEIRVLMVEQTIDFMSSNLHDTLETVKKLMEKADSDSVKLGAAKTILQMVIAQIKQLDLSRGDETPVKPEKKLDFRALSNEEIKLFLTLMAKMQGENEPGS
ncbi:MAG: hypothetical protein F4X14_10380 [Caldilineaceae bacterium SB0661_bin_32]|uniref:Uncharacterized protein n=1 Tax=Caldilineaceae bacterium SB0661_bin_32 TaxID=2605255 RepID=A0A6B1D6U8_9CHLR|nr:hypothetical protein [Caldilineaceae bacterium SB0661_bin_32]